MLNDYADIRDRIPEKPKWFDENGVPRYCDFAPDQCADIYADEAVLALITCQGCQEVFRVAFTISSHDKIVAGMRMGGKEEHFAEAMKMTLAQKIRDKTLHYGDPPNTRCCAAGPTMNSEPRLVLEYWHRERLDWVRDSDLEGNIEPDWVTDDH